MARDFSIRVKGLARAVVRKIARQGAGQPEAQGLHSARLIFVRSFSAYRDRILGPIRPLAAAARRILRQLAAPPSLRAMAPGILPLVLFPFIAPLIKRELNEPLFGDTAVFQYAGWCIRRGMRLFRDVGMADGPLIYYLHAAVQALEGITDRDFRRGDLWLQTGGGALIGLALAPISDLPRLGRFVQRLAWAGLGAAVWLAWYLTLDFGTTTEREMYYILFGSLGMTLLYVSSDLQPRWGTRAAFAGGFLVTTQLFGKPTGLIYVAMGAACLILADPVARRRNLTKIALAGAGTCVLTVLVTLLISGSIRDYFFWCFTIPYRGNLFLFRVDWLRLLLVSWDSYRFLAVVSLVGGVAAVAAGFLPRKALPFAFTPGLLFLGACLQGRGYHYQVEPTVGAANLLLLLGLAHLWQETGQSQGANLRRGLAAAALVLVTLYFFDDTQRSPYRWNGDATTWNVSGHEWAPDERKVGAYLKEHTKFDDYVFAYGGESHVVLFYAQRRTATPFFHAFWLDPIGLLSRSEVQPNAEERAALEQLQATIRERGCGAVEARRPAAMVFSDPADAFRICPGVKTMVDTGYVQTTTIGAFRIYLRRASAPGPGA
ncbi:MAG TPA: hypothetical protein VMT03_11295 [Polyangia bacterium]|nr:hypothetical protein [Polyangia bacterium]